MATATWIRVKRIKIYLDESGKVRESFENQGFKSGEKAQICKCTYSSFSLMNLSRMGWILPLYFSQKVLQQRASINQ